MIKYNERFFMRLAILFFSISIISLLVPLYLSTLLEVNIKAFSLNVVSFCFGLHFLMVANYHRKVAKAKKGSNVQ
ncbi:hypothetical protein IMZ08_17430 [Bacillus luteolus]|uniref:Uncharacterized protein n=1 Tax=Litchfieldia luteola TaxID=682179 RepID=A0ABR9QMZ4_9BACI|nr:hypothetical protein [Cytobacillus luteolus]MBE4909819.1 hypothetical protein [Cytobacillus luteolus]MBP1942632.1 positive regulator of sigma E activity [Cytobacillus luteolus]